MQRLPAAWDAAGAASVERAISAPRPSLRATFFDIVYFLSCCIPRCLPRQRRAVYSNAAMRQPLSHATDRRTDRRAGATLVDAAVSDVAHEGADRPVRQRVLVDAEVGRGGFRAQHRQSQDQRSESELED